LTLKPWYNLYPSSTSEESLYSSSGGAKKELDLREEFYSTLYGASDEVKKGQIGLIRRMRRNSSGAPIRCECRDPLTDEPSMDMSCSDCFGHGYLWDERKIVYYKNEDALRRWGYSVFYVEYDEEPTDIDFVVELERDTEGTPSVPIVRDRLYKIEQAEPFRSDDGRTEYWRIRAVYDKQWSVWPNRYIDTGVQVRSPGAAE